jgi:hypothetical protein
MRRFCSWDFFLELQTGKYLAHGGWAEIAVLAITLLEGIVYTEYSWSAWVHVSVLAQLLPYRLSDTIIGCAFLFASLVGWIGLVLWYSLGNAGIGSRLRFAAFIILFFVWSWITTSAFLHFGLAAPSIPLCLLMMIASARVLLFVWVESAVGSDEPR